MRAQLVVAGWRLVATQPNGESILRHDARGVHLLMREHPAEVQVMIIGSGEGDIAKDDFAQRVINTRWRTLKPRP